MDNFIVSARKYRPNTFDTVVGQASITNTLKNAIKSNHLAHAYLFCGPRGVGKTTCARIFARTINCVDLTPDIEACGECESCKSFSENRSYNIHELDAASNNSVDDIRNLTDQVRIPPQIGKYSVYIIDEVHMLSQAAFNAFLKTLEEPPKHALFILATTEKHKIIPTILSRCQIYDFNRMGVDFMVSHLKNIAAQESIKFEEEAFNIIAQKADGAMRDALSIFDQIVSFSGKDITYKKVIENLNILDYEYYFKITDAFLQENIHEALLLFNEVLSKGFDAHNFMNGLSKHLRDLLVIKDEKTIRLIEAGPAIKDKYKEQTQRCSGEFLYNALDISNEFDLGYRLSKDKRLHIELGLVKLSNILSVQKKKRQQQQLADEHNKDAANSGESKAPASRSTTVVPERKKAVETKPQKVSTPSIKEALKSMSVKAEEIEEDLVEEPVVLEEPENSEIFTPGQLVEKWNEYALHLKDKSMRMHITLKNREPKLLEGFKVQVSMDNSAQEEEFNREEKVSFTGFLRRELKNTLIEIVTVVEESKESAKKVYTDNDKLNFLIKKNPALQKLKNDLNLDFE